MQSLESKLLVAVAQFRLVGYVIYADFDVDLQKPVFAEVHPPKVPSVQVAQPAMHAEEHVAPPADA